MISKIERKYFDDLFNRGGYILDFSTELFDEFTTESVGIALCETYNLSKGKSLREFLREGEHSKVVKLLDELIQYYEVYYQEELNSQEKTYSGTTYAYLYKKCKEIIEREKQNFQPFMEVSESLKENFSSEYMNQQIDLMVNSCENNPTEAIGKSKELIESCCKSILEANGQEIPSNLKMGQLVKETLKVLDVPNSDIEMDPSEERILKQIIGSLNGLAAGISELRNHYGSGHGRIKSFKGLTKRHAELAVGSSITLVRYLWDTFLMVSG